VKRARVVDGGAGPGKLPVRAKAGPYVVIMRAKGIVAVDAHKPGPQRLIDTGVKGRVTSALPIDKGASLLFVVGGNALYRLTPGSPAQKLWSGHRSIHLFGASADGKTIAADRGQLITISGNTAKVIDTKPPAAVHQRSGAISADGQRLLTSIIPRSTCKEKSFKPQTTTRCPFEVWGFDRRAGKWQRVAAGKLHNYNGVFVPGSAGKRVMFEVPQPDSKCPTRPLWGCGREDLYAVDFDGANRTLVRHAAWVPRFSPDGKWMSVCSPWLGPDKGALLVGATGGPVHAIAHDCEYALSWGGHSDWIAYQSMGKFGVRVIRRDGSGSASAGEGRLLGFLSAAPKLGAIVPRTPTIADHIKAALTLAVKHNRGSQPIALVGLNPADARKVNITAPTSRVSLGELAGMMNKSDRFVAVVDKVGLCRVHRSSSRSYAVLGDPEAELVVITNKLLPGETDRGTLRKLIRSKRPAHTGRPVAATYGNAIELVGVDMPARVKAGSKFTMTLYFHAIGTIRQPWKTFVHFDGAGVRFQADHKIACGLNTLSRGDWLVDRFQVQSIATTPETYRGFIGFFTGSHGSWRSMKVSKGKHDGNNRVFVGTVDVD